MIETAAILSAYIQHWEDAWIISALLLLNAVVGFWQEKKADNAIELLKQKLALKARVLRDRNWQEVSARELALDYDFTRCERCLLTELCRRYTHRYCITA